MPVRNVRSFGSTHRGSCQVAGRRCLFSTDTISCLSSISDPIPFRRPAHIAAARQIRQDRIQTFSVGYAEHEYSELPYARLIELQKAGLWSAPIEVVAARLRTRPRRLRNDLAHEGESFQDIRTRLRGELAGAYLLASDLPVTSIGFALGFSEPGSFSRHFIAWAGMPPSAYRAAHASDAMKVAAATALLNERRPG